MQEKKVIELLIEDVLPNRFQPRIKFNEESINELAASIKKYGVIQPIVVRKIGNKYEIIAGERRYKASVLAGMKTIPAIVSELTDKDSVEIALIENVQREDLTPIEKAISYKKILDMGYITQEELASKVGKSQSAIANSLRLLNLSDEVQEALLENKISERHARSLLKIKDTNKQNEMLNRIINERLTVRRTDEEIDKMLNGENSESTLTLNSGANTIEPTPVDTLPVENIISIPDENPTIQDNFELPGFMNIDKIQNEAMDINKEEIKPIVNMDELLNSTSHVVPQQDEINKENETLHSNKFFNFFDEINDENDTNNGTSIDIPTIPQLDQQSFEVPNIDTQAPTFEVPSIDAQAPTFEVPSIDAQAPTFEVPNIDTQAPTFEVPSIDAQAPTFEVPNIDAQAPTFEVPSIDAQAPTFEVPSIDTQTPTFEVPNIDAQAPTFEIPSIDAQAPTFEVPEGNDPLYEIPQSDAINAEANTIPSSIPSEVEIIPNVEVNPIINNFEIPEEETIDNVNINIQEVKPDIKSALEAIRNCERELEAKGFKVEADEIDLDDSYHVIFKIQK